MTVTTPFAFRNPAYNGLGNIDCEIEVGDEWLPFTAMPDDVEQHGRDLYAAIIAAGNIVPYTPPAATAADLKARAQAVRADAANGSAAIDVGNGRMVPCWTDSESRGSALGLVVAAQANPTLSTVWKGADGAYYTLNAAEIVALSMGILTHVEKCFAAEAQIDQLIEAGTVTATAQVDAVFQSLML